jgi:20S proteasome alpha/beta subunit
MSLAIAIQTRDGIVIASDSRGTFGDPRGVTGANDTIQKLYGLSKHAAIAVAGANEIGATLLNRLYSREMNLSSATELAAYCISETATQDGKVGGPIQIGQITVAGGFSLLPEKQVNEVLKGNLNRTKRLKKLFFGNKKMV